MAGLSTIYKTIIRINLKFGNYQVKFLDCTLDNISIMVLNHSTAQKFWTDLAKCIEEEIRNSSPAIQQMLEEEYPQLLKSYCEMTKKLNFSTYSLK